jgi:hypothetical protein
MSYPALCSYVQTASVLIRWAVCSVGHPSQYRGRVKDDWRLKFLIAPLAISLVLVGCGASHPKVQLGYLSSGNDQIPAAFVAFEPGMTISATNWPPPYTTSRHTYYKETITFASGSTSEIEFFVTTDFTFEATIDGQATALPALDTYATTVEPTLKDQMAFAFLGLGFKEPLMHIPSLCSVPGELVEHTSPIPNNPSLQSLDSITLTCPATGKTNTLEFSYVRDLSTKDCLITSFTVKIIETSTASPKST